MSNFLYNGVELPGLPETWNEAAHPHLFIRVVSLDGSAENAVYSLFAASAAAVSYDDNGILFPSSAVGEKYAVSDGAWVESSESLSDAFYIKRNDGFLYTLWANFDILNSDGSVYIAASEPVPVAGKFPLREWVGWLIAGLCSRPLPVSVREPVAYLYNGVRLPKLPVYDKSKNPCAVLIDVTTVFDSTPRYRLFLSAGYIIREHDGYCGIGLSAGKNGIISYDCYHLIVADGYEWGDPKTGYIDGYSMSNTLRNDVIWTDTDIELPDGTVYLSASEPVPVYE